MYLSMHSVSQPARVTSTAAPAIAVPMSLSPKKSALPSILERRKSIAAWLACAVLAFAAIGCNGPCEELANKICDCELSTTLKNQCLEQVRSAMQNRQVTNEESQVCEQKLDTCDCDRLASEDFAACGLQK